MSNNKQNNSIKSIGTPDGAGPAGRAAARYS